jgi:hypothetical protein
MTDAHAGVMPCLSMACLMRRVGFPALSVGDQ